MIICYDGDTQRKRQVRQAMGELAAFLTKDGAVGMAQIERFVSSNGVCQCGD